MKKEQLEDKFIICRTQDEFEFIQYYAEKLLGIKIGFTFTKPICIRIGATNSGFASGEWGWNDIGDYEADPDYKCEKEEECSVLFGNLIKRWKHENRA